MILLNFFISFCHFLALVKYTSPLGFFVMYGDEIPERTLGLLRKSNANGPALAEPSSFVRLTPDYGGQDGATGSEFTRIKSSPKGDRECTRRGRQPNPPPPSDSTELAEVLRRDRPLMNQPSSGSRRTMAGRLQIYADEVGRGIAAKTGPRMDANLREEEKSHAKTQRGGKMVIGDWGKAEGLSWV